MLLYLDYKNLCIYNIINEFNNSHIGFSISMNKSAMISKITVT